MVIIEFIYFYITITHNIEIIYIIRKMSIIDTEPMLFQYTLYFLHIVNIALLIGFTIINPSILRYIETGILLFTSIFLIYKFYNKDVSKITNLDNRIIFHLAMVIFINSIVVPISNDYHLIAKVKNALNQYKYQYQY